MSRAAVRSALAAFALVLSLVAAAGANAAIITASDAQGRPITFDVRASAVDTNWYASVLSAIDHGNEISNVTIRIVPDQSVESRCGPDAAACYTRLSGRPTIIIPAGKSTSIEGTLIHEYGHHLDASTSVPGIPELNGTPAWWAGRGMAALFDSRQVAFDYSLGWDHSIPEIFAEDYAYIMVGPSYHYAITWLGPPSDALKAAMFAELGTPTQPLPAAPNLGSITRKIGTLAPRGRKVVKFGLLGPGRRVTLTATVSRPQRKGVRARLQVECNGTVAGTRTIGRGQTKRTLALQNMGPGDCEASVISVAPVSLKYDLRLQLQAPNEGAR